MRRAIGIAALLCVVAAPVLAQSNTAQAIRYGTIVSAERTIVKDRPTGTGATVGSTAGAVAGYAIAGGRDRWLGALVGGVLGGAAGKGIEAGARKRKGWQLIVKIDDGGEIGVKVVGKKQQHFPGDKVRLMTGPGGKTEVHTIED